MKKSDSQFLGFCCGLIGPLIGGYLYYLMLFRQMGINEFFQTMIKSGSVAQVISLAAVFNLIVFFIFIWLKFDKSARGVILATFLYVLSVILIKFA